MWTCCVVVDLPVTAVTRHCESRLGKGCALLVYVLGFAAPMLKLIRRTQRPLTALAHARTVRGAAAVHEPPLWVSPSPSPTRTPTAQPRELSFHFEDDKASDTPAFCSFWPPSAAARTLDTVVRQRDTVVRQHDMAEPAAALASPILEEGVNMLTFAVQGDAIVGVASALPREQRSAEEWQAKAWGVSTATGCLHYASSATEEGMLGIEIGPQRLVEDSCTKLIHLELDMDESRLRLRHGSGKWRDVPVRLPLSVRPWVLFGAGSEGVRPAVELVSCTLQPVNLSAVSGLRDLVGRLSVPDQRRALAWCTSEGIFDVAAINGCGLTHEFIQSTVGSHVPTAHSLNEALCRLA